jgi:hypothetical protein
MLLIQYAQCIHIPVNMLVDDLNGIGIQLIIPDGGFIYIMQPLLFYCIIMLVFYPVHIEEQEKLHRGKHHKSDDSYQLV